jgi:lipoprotein-anchoring transpeptidase ErfK/SrfK
VVAKDTIIVRLHQMPNMLMTPDLTYWHDTIPEGYAVVAVGEKGIEDHISHTPTGVFKVIYMKKDPIYIDAFTGKQLAGPYIIDKKNVYGTRIIGLSYIRHGRHLCIHGTNEPELIPGYVSHMCVRMKNADVEWLFDRVHVGDTVVITE